MINPPPTRSPIVNDSGMINPEWQEFFSAAFFSLRAQEMSGTTANRPTKRLFVGMPYFDTTLNRPIWYTGTNWIRADGVVV
jgi:hypothetical protein